MPSANAIERLENEFWQALVDKDVDRACSMMADECVLVDVRGISRINPETYRALLNDRHWSMDSFEFSDVDVIFTAEDTAIMTYRVHQQGRMLDKAMDMRCVDSTVWVRDGDAWKCALHTETILE